MGSGKGGAELPSEFRFVQPAMLDLLRGGKYIPFNRSAVANVNFAPTGTTQSALRAGGQAFGNQSDLLRGINTEGAAQAFGLGLGGLEQGIATGFMPTFGGITSQLGGMLQPELERQFDLGSAAIREQAALSGGLTSSGTTDTLGQFRGQLASGLLSNVGQAGANIFGQALPTAISTRAGLTEQALGLPGQLQGSLFGPIAGLGLQASQFQQGFPLEAYRVLASLVGGAPLQQQPSNLDFASTLAQLGLVLAAI